MKLVATILVALLGTPMRAQGGTVTVETCDDLETAVATTATEDTTALFTSAFLSCQVESQGDGEYAVRTYTIMDNRLTIVAPDIDKVTIYDARFDLVSSAELYVTPDIVFDMTFRIDEAVEENGGCLHIEEGSIARFRRDLEVYNFEVRSVVVPGSDSSADMFYGGCVWNQGYLRVGGHATFERCDNIGGGETFPGDGGGIYNGESGSVLFVGGVTMEDIDVTEDDGNHGAGIYNAGKINIKGDSLFNGVLNNRIVGLGGAIYNAEGATFTFRKGAMVAFSNNQAAAGAAIFNRGSLTFAGPALFVRSEGMAIANSSPGYMKLSSETAFWFNIEIYGYRSGTGGMVWNELGATLDYPDDLLFLGNEGDSCDDIFFETEEGYTCYP